MPGKIDKGESISFTDPVNMTSRFYCMPPLFVPSMEDIERVKSIGIARMMQAHIYADKRTHIIHKTEDTTQDTQCTTDLQDAIHNIGHAIQDTQHTYTDKHNTYSTQNKRAHTHPAPEMSRPRTGLPMDCTSEQANKAFSQYGTAPWFYWFFFFFLPTVVTKKVVTFEFESIFSNF